MSGWDWDGHDYHERLTRVLNIFAKQLYFARRDHRPTFWLRLKALPVLTWRLIKYIICG